MNRFEFGLNLEQMRAQAAANANTSRIEGNIRDNFERDLIAPLMRELERSQRFPERIKEAVELAMAGITSMEIELGNEMKAVSPHLTPGEREREKRKIQIKQIMLEGTKRKIREMHPDLFTEDGFLK